jgi:hypothetical protein
VTRGRVQSIILVTYRVGLCGDPISTLTVKWIFLQMNPLMLQGNLQEKPARVIAIKINLKKLIMLKAVSIKFLL